MAAIVIRPRWFWMGKAGQPQSWKNWNWWLWDFRTMNDIFAVECANERDWRSKNVQNASTCWNTLEIWCVSSRILLLQIYNSRETRHLRFNMLRIADWNIRKVVKQTKNKTQEKKMIYIYIYVIFNQTHYQRALAFRKIQIHLVVVNVESLSRPHLQLSQPCVGYIHVRDYIILLYVDNHNPQQLEICILSLY